MNGLHSLHATVLDKFFKNDSDIETTTFNLKNDLGGSKVVTCANWDTPSSLHIDSFYAHLSRLHSQAMEKDLLSPNRPTLSSEKVELLREDGEVSSLIERIKEMVLEKNISHIYLVDGFLLYLEPLDEILSHLDLPLFFHAPLDVLLDRRLKRLLLALSAIPWQKTVM